MRKVIYLMSASLDGFIEGRDGRFDWSEPSEEVHRFYNEQARDFGAFLYGRRMYEVMQVWQTLDQEGPVDEHIREFAEIWRSKQKIVFSKTLSEVVENSRIVRESVEAEVSALKEQPGGDLGVGGAGLARSLAQADLIDEYRLVFSPILVGGGKSYFPAGEQNHSLRLIEQRAFPSGEVYLRYERVREK